MVWRRLLLGVLVVAAPLEPEEIGLREHVERKIVQIDVTVRGPREAVRSLAREDFLLAIAGRRIDDFTVDNLCALPPQERLASGTAEDQPAPSEPVALRTPVTYLFYFDQAHLTMAGRLRSVELARTLVEKLIVPPHRAMIISNGLEVRVFSEPTSDKAVLIAGLDRLEQDRRQWDTYAQGEDERVARVTEARGEMRKPPSESREVRAETFDRPKSGGGLEPVPLVADPAKLAFQLAGEDVWHTERALRRFEMVLGRFAGVDSPKAVIYFADTLRSKPGEHYLSLFSNSERSNNGHDNPNGMALSGIEIGSGAAASVYDRVINAAAAHGVRLYTVEAQGLVAPSMTSTPSRASSMSSPMPWHKRHADAQDGLAGLALETGGRAFLNGVSALKIAREIGEDLACVYLISVDATALPRKRVQRVSVQIERSGVTAQARGRLFVLDEAALVASRLLAAFVAPETGQPGSEHLIVTSTPIDATNGQYRSLVQVRIPPAMVRGAVWDVGLSLVAHGAVEDEQARRITLEAPDALLVYETELRFAPGPFEVVAVAYEQTTQRILTGRVDGELPRFQDAHATVGGVALSQPHDEFVFQRGANTRFSGPLMLAEHEPILTNRPTAFVSVVCADTSRRVRNWHAERSVEGASTAPFPSVALVFDGAGCIQVRDVIQAGILTPGSFRYHLSVFEQERKLADTERAFAASSP